MESWSGSPQRRGRHAEAIRLVAKIRLNMDWRALGFGACKAKLTALAIDHFKVQPSSE